MGFFRGNKKQVTENVRLYTFCYLCFQMYVLGASLCGFQGALSVWNAV